MSEYQRLFRYLGVLSILPIVLGFIGIVSNDTGFVFVATSALFVIILLSAWCFHEMVR